MKCAIQLIYPLAAEIFDTKVRTTGFGISSGMGRIGSIIMPFILIPLDMWNQWAVYVLFGILSFLASIITLCLIDETMNKIIDNTTMKEEITEIKEVKDK
jgi:nitrate/nitrite transporter NarK